MFSCDQCDAVFSTSRQLAGHKSIHKPGGRYSVSRKQAQKEAICQNCHTSFWFLPCQSIGKFCSNRCFHEDRKKTLFKPRFDAGGAIDVATLKFYVTERDGYKCAECGIVDWQNKPLSMDIDHIDGDSTNNNPENLRILCPNCHRQTDSWGNKKSRPVDVEGRRVLSGRS